MSGIHAYNYSAKEMLVYAAKSLVQRFEQEIANLTDEEALSGQRTYSMTTWYKMTPEHHGCDTGHEGAFALIWIPKKPKSTVKVDKIVVRDEDGNETDVKPPDDYGGFEETLRKAKRPPDDQITREQMEAGRGASKHLKGRG